MLKSRRLRPLWALAAVQLSACDHDFFEPILREIKHGHGGHGPKDPGHHEPPCECTETQHQTRNGRCIANVESVSAGIGYTCAILEDRGLKCWGGDSWFRLGYGAPGGTRGDAPGELGDALPEVPLGAGLFATQVVADSDLTCALLQTGGVKCWGYNGYGSVLGVPAPASVGASVDTLPVRTFGAGRSAVEIDAGSGQAIALLDDGTLVRWGITNSVIDLGAGRVATTFARGTSYDNWHLCAVLDDGNVACKAEGGGGSAGQLGRDPSLDPPSMPASGYPLVDLGSGRTASQVALGDAHTCALLDGGDVKCWGYNAYGQLGLGDTDSRGLLASEMGDALGVVPLPQPAVAISAGRQHSCALLQDGTVKCWGRNDTGQLGIGSTEDVGDEALELIASSSVDLGPGRSAVSIDGGGHTCAVLDNGGIKCWGENALGQLGQGDVLNRGGLPNQLGQNLPEIDLGS